MPNDSKEDNNTNEEEDQLEKENRIGSEREMLNSNRNSFVRSWRPYKLAPLELAPFKCMCESWYKFRNTAGWPLWYRIPFIQRPIGMVLYMLITAVVGLYMVTKAAVDDEIIPREVPSFFLLTTFVFATRNSFVTFFTGISYESQLLLHKFSCYMSVITGIFHGVECIVKAGWENENTQTGFTMWTAMVILMLQGLFFKFLVKYFQWFVKFHWIFFILILVIAPIHGPLLVTIVGGGVWVLDLLFRLIFSCIYSKSTKKLKIEKLPCDIFKMSFNKNESGLDFKPGQYCFITIPSISPFQGHPFSIVSTPYDKNVIFYGKVLRFWTEELYKKCEKTNEVSAYVDGPYGVPMINIEGNKYEAFLLISGGIGITPIQSIANTLIHESKSGRRLKKIIFVWTGKDIRYLDEIVSSPRLYNSFFDQESESQKKERFFNSYIHITRSTKQKIDAFDFPRRIFPKVLPGRPNLEMYFDKALSSCKSLGLKKIGVMCCGPDAMMTQTKRLSERYNGKDGVSFHLHYETFDFLDELI